MTALKKDITRFSPVWALYTIFLLLCLLLIGQSNNFSTSYGYANAQDIAETISYMPVINFVYALLCAQLLFGDLYNARLCNSLHAMPLRRESWFGVHILAGVLFSLVPNLLAALVSVPMTISQPGVPWLWLAGTTLQYLFFFGVAVFCACSVGSRFAMALVYAIINFLALLVYWFAEVLYQPLLYGVQINTERFLTFCPVVQMVGNSYVNISRIWDALTDSTAAYTMTIGDGWRYAWICAGIGVVFAALGLLLYRRRNLECAGDFIAFKPMQPVFLVLFSLIAGAVFYILGQIDSDTMGYILMVIGIFIGFFLGQMLLKRTIRVFTGKTFAWLGVLLAALLCSLGIIKLDPIGVTRWVPEVEEVEAVWLTNSRYSSASYIAYSYEIDTTGESDIYTYTDPADIASILSIHSYAIAEREDDTSVPFSITYRLKNGTIKTRYYSTAPDSTAGQALKALFSAPEYIFGEGIRDTERYVQSTQWVELYDYDSATLTREELASLLEALILDFDAGNGAQDWDYHEDHSNTYCWLSFYRSSHSDRDGDNYYGIRICSCCENAFAWIIENGYGNILSDPDAAKYAATEPLVIPQ